MNIFIEGLQGTGKTTLLNNLSKKYPEYKAYREGDVSPVELAWCSYMKEEDYNRILEKYDYCRKEIEAKTMREGEYYITAYTQVLAENRSFYEEMEAFEIYNARVDFKTFHDVIMGRYRAFEADNNIFECSFFQNSIESMMLFYEMEDEEIVEFYREAYEILKHKNFRMYYLDSERIRENILQIRKERSDEQGNEMWYPLMLGYLKESPYGQSHGYRDMEDMIAHFERRRALELRIIGEVIGAECTVLAAKEYDVCALQYEKSCGAVVYCRMENEIKYLLACENNGYWVFPKGHMEVGESEYDTAWREVKEETGLDVTFVEGFRVMDEHSLAREGRPNTIKQTVYFLATYEKQMYTRQETEISKLVLLNYEKALDILQFDSFKRILTQAHQFLDESE